MYYVYVVLIRFIQLLQTVFYLNFIINSITSEQDGFPFDTMATLLSP